jgi:hypothetical protein
MTKNPGDIRADIIALGGKGGKYFPVFIELKAIRSKRVIEQLILAQQETAKVKPAFIETLEKGTGKAASSISFDDYKLLVVWPKAPSGKGKASAAEVVAAPRFESIRSGASSDAREHLAQIPTANTAKSFAAKQFRAGSSFLETAVSEVLVVAELLAAPH